MLTITANESRYIWPPRAKLVVPRSELSAYISLGWAAQLKYNGARCLIKYRSNGQIELWNRHAERFRNYTAPDFLIEQLQSFRAPLNMSNDSWSLIDGELIDFKHHAIRDTIAIWDILVHNGQALIGTSYASRYNTLHGLPQSGSWHYKEHDFGIKLADNVLMPRCHTGAELDSLWDLVHRVNAPFTDKATGEVKPLLEGTVLKDVNATLEMGFKETNNGSWMIRSRVQTGRHLF